MSESVVNWRDYNGCNFGEKMWGKFEHGEFQPHGEYEQGDFPIVWCNHDGRSCSCEGYCQIKDDHESE